MAIAKDMDEKRQALKKLVDAFKRNLDQYTAQKYIEERVRTDFVDKFFELFDWDISNEEGFIEEFRDVTREDNVEISGEQKYPDYSFRIGGNTVFFVETKKPSVNVKESIPSAYQVRRYGFSGKLKISILTDFHEFAIYDTQRKPGKNDKADLYRLFYCTFDEYEKYWDLLYGLLAKENVKKGSINEFVGKTTKRGASEVDKEFLKMIDGWRTELAKNIARSNKRLELGQLNMAVQKIIDRIIFLRICGEKDIEPFDKLKGIGESGKNVYGQLVSYFEAANRKYNSELFKPETFINDLKIEDEVLADIISDLYYPSPYAFSVLPVEILGNIYEQFLGKTIHLTETHQARIEKKPEVRKAGGVYYTPKYIVDYIVKNTVGEKVKGATPKEIEKLKILDPACGSGSFLLGAYSYLLIHHLAYYTKKDILNKALKGGNIYQAGKNSYRLTIGEKQNILLNNIFGIDIDAQAVEVTKLSLLLKLMEGESQESAGKLFKHSDTKFLPNLSANIKCGNSLTGNDFYEGVNMNLFDDKELQSKINAFDWEDKEKGFGEIMAKGGFDAVIGNPPYVDSELMTKEYPEERGYISRKYKVAKGNWDLYIPFFEVGYRLIRKNGFLSLITPNKWLTMPYAEELRAFLLKDIYRITDCSKIKVFESGNNPLIAFIEKNNNRDYIYKDTFEENFSVRPNEKVSRSILAGSSWGHILAEDIGLIAKLSNSENTASSFCTAENPFSVSEAYDMIKLLKNSQQMNLKVQFKFVNTGTIDRYSSLWGIKPTTYIKSKYSFPVVNRMAFKKHFPRRFDQSIKPKIIISGMRHFECFFDKAGEYIAGKSTEIISNPKNLSFYTLLAILNSRLISYYLRQKYSTSGIDGGINFTTSIIGNLPIPVIPPSSERELSALVGQMHETQIKFHSAKPESDKKHYQQKIGLIDRQIDDLVYELYGLTKEEIKIVEGSNR